MGKQMLNVELPKQDVTCYEKGRFQVELILNKKTHEKAVYLL